MPLTTTSSGSPGAGGTPLAVVVRPHLRGWVHAAALPQAVAAGVVLVVLTPRPDRWASAVFAVTAAALFATSATYHLRSWSSRVAAALRRADHATIFVVIAGTYTPFAVLLLPPASAWWLLALVWTGAAVGAAFGALWPGAPRWLHVPLYVVLGWGAVGWLPAFAASGGAAVVALVIGGGVLYTAGAVVYGVRHPDPSPRWFGFHEVFHVLTVGGFAAHVVGAYLAALSGPGASS